MANYDKISAKNIRESVYSLSEPKEYTTNRQNSLATISIFIFTNCFVKKVKISYKRRHIVRERILFIILIYLLCDI